MENNNGNKINKFLIVISVVLCVLLIASLVSIGNLQNDMQNMRNNFNRSISIIQDDINGMSGEMYNYIEQKASIIAYSEYEMGDVDVETSTALLNVCIAPKEYDEIETAAFFEIAGQQYEMTREGSEFMAVIPLDMFSEYSDIKVAFREGSNVRTEMLNWHISPRGESIPMVYAHFIGSWSGGIDSDKGNYIWTPSGQIEMEIDFYKEKSLSAKSAEVVYEVDGKEVYAEKIDVTNLSEVKSSVQQELTEKAKVPFGSTLTIYTELVDNYGLHHINVIEHIKIDGDGDIADDDEEDIWRYGEQIIMNEDGEIIYDPYEQYVTLFK